MIISVHQPQYIPWLGYFEKIARSDCFVFLDCVQYKVREFQNRNKIRTKSGWIWLSVPVETKGQGRQNICDIRIDNESDWRKQHLRSLETWYGKSRFFDKYRSFLKEIYSREWEKLADLNIAIVRYILKELSITTKICYESELKINTTKTERIIDICKSLKADTYLSGIGGKDYLEEEKFSAAEIKLVYQDFSHPVYQQQFMKNETDFLPYMSVLDLLFNQGENSRQILKLSNFT